jgi:feruloyl esterase
MVYEDPKWSFQSFDLERDTKVADDKAGAYLNSVNPDLKAFHARGGKLILYHGWADAAIPPLNAINYYNSVIATMGEREAAKFVRLFMVPGMQHCYGGPGPFSFGQLGESQDPDRDINVAVERWVEKGAAPETIVAAKLVSEMDPKKGVSRTRPLCAYPKVAKWKGSGSTDDAANFTCVNPIGK